MNCKRKITIDDQLLSLLVSERERHLRIMAETPTAPRLTCPGSQAAIRRPDVSEFRRRPAKASHSRSCVPRGTLRKSLSVRPRGSASLTYVCHDLRGSHETMLLNSGIPIHEVAARCGHDPAVMLRSYAKRTKKADEKAASVTGSLLKGALHEDRPTWVQTGGSCQGVRNLATAM